MSSATPFGHLPDGSPVTLYTLRHGNVEAAFLNYGARIQSLRVPDASGTLAEITTGYATLEQYLADNTYAGAVVGRFGNRIANGRFTLDGVTHTLPQNNTTNCLHGGPVGFDKKTWTAIEFPDNNAVGFTLISPAGDMGFPGTLTATIRYTLSASGLQLDYSATTDAPTVVNLTNHVFFNLAGESSGTILDHEITIPAAAFTPVTESLVPTGELRPVQGTVFDLRQPTRVGQNIDNEDPQLQIAGGWDHNFVLGDSNDMKTAAILRDPASGRTLTVSTTEPGVQFYSGNFMTGKLPNRTGGLYPRRGGLCLETQHFPDSPNHPTFPSTVLRPGEIYRSTTLFAFGSK